MHKNPSTRNPQSSGRIRAFRKEDPEQQLARSALVLGLSGEFTRIDADRPQRLARALRVSRRAAMAGNRDYDPVRHLLLVRYMKTLTIPGN